MKTYLVTICQKFSYQPNPTIYCIELNDFEDAEFVVSRSVNRFYDKSGSVRLIKMAETDYVYECMSIDGQTFFKGMIEIEEKCPENAIPSQLELF